MITSRYFPKEKLLEFSLVKFLLLAALVLFSSLLLGNLSNCLYSGELHNLIYDPDGSSFKFSSYALLLAM
jgi:hypothetical protein|uniref:Uncharacterized protein n=1 Tax=Picea sitchensis TaxID=3332 RepID=A0A6B9XUM7_PICSI|nr:hypothetical protein Q903MT_gene6638 [Picea sitchensis]